MKLSRASSYALHAVVHMAIENTQKPLASHDIARAHGIPERFLLKVLKPLGSCRFRSGGFQPPREFATCETLRRLEAAATNGMRGTATA